MRKKVKIREINPYSLDGSIEDAIKMLIGIKDSVPEGLENVRLDYCPPMSYGASDDMSFFVVGDREETEKEKAKRLKEETVIEAKHLAREKKEFERLSKMFAKE